MSEEPPPEESRFDESDRPDLVAGEARSDLREALSVLRTRRLDDGSLELSGEIPERLAEPLVRAMSWVQDELRLDDAARAVHGGPEPRAEGHLRADALMALILRVTDT